MQSKANTAPPIAPLRPISSLGSLPMVRAWDSSPRPSLPRSEGLVARNSHALRKPERSEGAAESVGFEPTVPSRVHLISNQAPSATRTALRRGTCRQSPALSSRRAKAAPQRVRNTVAPPWRLPAASASGEMTEWPKVHDWKSCVPARVPRVRIPLSPPAPSLSEGAAKREGVLAARPRPQGEDSATNPSRAF
jgi:hypothetical protein